jgi:hypothetical protein
VPERRFRRDRDAAVVAQPKGRRAVARLERALGLSCRDQVFGRTCIASAASRLLGFVAGREAAAGVFSLFVMSGLPSARGGQ